MYPLTPSNIFVYFLCFFTFRCPKSKRTSDKRAVLVANSTKVSYRFCNTEYWSKLPPVAP